MTQENSYTPAQEAAVFSDSDRILVSAGAGSGKTFVMTERIVRLIEERKVPADKFLVVTFTNAAAAQMKKRIRDALAKRAAEDETGFLFEQLPLLEFSQISTVHSLCLSLIREYYQSAGVDPSFGMLSADEADILLTEAVDEAFEALYREGDPLFVNFVDAYTSRDEIGLKALIRSTVNFLEERPDKELWIRALTDREAYTNEEDYLSSPAANCLKDYIGNELKRALEIYEEGLRLARMDDDEKHKRSGLFESYTQDVGDLLNTLRVSGITGLSEALAGYRAKTFNTRGTEDRAWDGRLKALKEAANLIVRDLKKIPGFSVGRCMEFSGACVPHMKSLGNVCALTEKIYSEKKTLAGKLDFQDLEHLCLKVLEDPAVLSSVRGRYGCIFVDEYQDTNDMQEAIVERLSEGGKLFTVGDVKQSIYAFRGADPSLFTDRRRRYENEGAGKVIQLSENFRSDGRIIDAVNDLFSDIMTPASSGIDYIGDREAMKSVRHYEGGAVPVVTAVLYDKEDLNEDGTEKDKVEEEALYLSSLVSRLLTEKITDRNTGELRKVRPSDIAILSRRSKGFTAPVVKALRDSGIPVDAPSTDSFYDLPEIALAVNLLKITDNYMDDVAMASVLRSIVYGFSPDDLVRIRLFGKDRGIRSFHECVMRYDTEDETGSLLRKFREDLADFSEYETHAPVHELIDRIYSVTNLYRLAGTLPDGKTRQENLTALRDMASSFESGAVRGLGAFIKYAQKAKETGKFRMENRQTSENGVKLMTIHGSKGLEFEIVIAADCGHDPNRRDTGSHIICDSRAGISMVLCDPEQDARIETIEHLAAQKEKKRTSEAEEMRLLYVAATRAIQRLYFTGSVKKKDYDTLLKKTEGLGKFCGGNYLKLLYAGLYGKDTAEFITYDPSSPSVILPREIPACPEEEKNTVADLRDTIEKKLFWHYPGEADLSVPTKMSVSALKTGEGLEIGKKVIALSDAPLFGEERKKTSLLKGTLTHLLLENVSREGLKEDIDEELKRTVEELLTKGLLPEGSEELIDLGSVKAFFSTDLGRRFIEAEELYREHEFILREKARDISDEWKDSDEYILIQGIIDCVLVHEGKTVILDYKTDRNLTPERLGMLNEEYSVQVRTYVKAWEALTGRKPDEAYICYLSGNMAVRVE